MGSNDYNPYDNEVPVHDVTVPDFEMAQSEVTVAQYRACVNAGTCSEPILLESSNCDPADVESYAGNWGVAGRDDHPVNCVNWHRAVAFCEWAGGRLPSESEWEYAARSQGQATYEYPWGATPGPSCDNAIMADGSSSAGCGADGTWPVCSRPNGDTDQLLCDMAGNLAEWVQDIYHGSYNCDTHQAFNCGGSGVAPDDGSAWEEGNPIDRVYRNGAFDEGDMNMRTAYRYAIHPDTPKYNRGFRCAR